MNGSGQICRNRFHKASMQSTHASPCPMPKKGTSELGGAKPENCSLKLGNLQRVVPCTRTKKKNSAAQEEVSSSTPSWLLLGWIDLHDLQAPCLGPNGTQLPGNVENLNCQRATNLRRALRHLILCKPSLLLETWPCNLQAPTANQYLRMQNSPHARDPPLCTPSIHLPRHRAVNAAVPIGCFAAGQPISVMIN